MIRYILILSAIFCSCKTICTCAGAHTCNRLCLQTRIVWAANSGVLLDWLTHFLAKIPDRVCCVHKKSSGSHYNIYFLPLCVIKTNPESKMACVLAVAFLHNFRGTSLKSLTQSISSRKVFAKTKVISV